METCRRLDVPVDIFAIIYIYNPPDREKLGTGTASANNPPASRDLRPPSTPRPQSRQQLASCTATQSKNRSNATNTPPATPGK